MTTAKIEKLLFSLLIYCGAFFLIVARRPDIIFHAQPWAEDGTVWLSDAYNNGILSSLFHPQNGYYQTISRIAYGLGLFFGISKAALVANILAISIRCCFILFILSKRFLFVDLKYRIAVVLYFIVMPNISEGFVNITNAHWYLAIYLVAVVMAEPPRDLKWKLHDIFVLFIASLSGPFIIFVYAGFLVKKVCVYKNVSNIWKSITAFDVLASFLFLIQFVTIAVSSNGDRSSAPLGASFSILCDIIVYRIFGGTFVSSEYIHSFAFGGVLNEVIVLFFILAFVFVLWKQEWRFKVISVFVLLMISFALAKPMMSMDSAQWPIFLMPNTGERYFIVTNFSFFCLIIWLVAKMGRFSNIILMSLLILMSPLMLKSYNINPIPNVGFEEDVLKFKNSDQGASVKIRIAPQGWYMILNKQ